MPNTQTVAILISPLFIIKIMILTLMVLYLIFAFVIVRQEQLFSKVVEIGGTPVLRILALIHFFTALALFIASVLFL